MPFDARTAYLPADVGWHNWGQFFTDVQVWRPVVKRICRQNQISAAEEIDAGYPGSCAVFVVDSQVVVKLFPPIFPHDCAREREVYRLLDERVSVLPRLLAAGTYGDQIDWPYLILEFRPGQPIREKYTAVSPANKQALARELGLIIRQVHQTPLINANQFDPHPATWRSFLDTRRDACVQELRQKTSIPDKVLAEITPYLESMQLLPRGFVPVLINGDLTDDHLLLVQNGETWQISALIDWADALVGAPEYEWVAYWFALCRQDSEMFKETLRAYDPALVLNDSFRRRMLAFTFMHRFGADIVAHVWDRDGRPPVHTLGQLLDRLWPSF